MPYFEEKHDGTLVKVEEELNMETIGDDVLAIYTVNEKISRSTTFVRQSVAPKVERKFRCRDGQLKSRSEMNEDDIAFMKEKLQKARDARAATRAAKAAASAA